MRTPKIIRQGFTLLEMFVVLAVVGILLTMMLPAINSIRESVRRTKCANNLKQICIAMQTYHQSHRFFPINWGADANPLSPIGAGVIGHSWLSMLLPNIEQGSLYQQIQFGMPMPADSINEWVAQQPISIFNCPSDFAGNSNLVQGTSDTQVLALSIGKPVGVTNYKACSGSNWDGVDSDFAASTNIDNGGWHKKADYNPKYPKYNTTKYGYPYGGFFVPQGRSLTAMYPGGAGDASYDGNDYGDGAICRGWGTPNGKPITTSMFYNDVKDGVSSTFAVGETVPAWCAFASWYWWNGANATCGIPLNWLPNNTPMISKHEDVAFAAYFKSTAGFMSRHSGGANFGYCDGGVHFISENIDMPIYHALATIDGGEIFNAPE
jgi:prepilin-type N-terminal cleavage/methylation domain-containing protein/prepilin-type processing-associated H-X9-DG protein